MCYACENASQELCWEDCYRVSPGGKFHASANGLTYIEGRIATRCGMFMAPLRTLRIASLTRGEPCRRCFKVTSL